MTLQNVNQRSWKHLDNSELYFFSYSIIRDYKSTLDKHFWLVISLPRDQVSTNQELMLVPGVLTCAVAEKTLWQELTWSLYRYLLQRQGCRWQTVFISSYHFCRLKKNCSILKTSHKPQATFYRSLKSLTMWQCDSVMSPLQHVVWDKCIQEAGNMSSVTLNLCYSFVVFMLLFRWCGDHLM